jgi:fermentation-respiration switch protein FrsA (DUF1100 family)
MFPPPREAPADDRNLAGGGRGKRVRAAGVVLVVVLAGAFGWKTHDEAQHLITNAHEGRKVATSTPLEKGLEFEDVSVTTADGKHLKGWFIPAVGPATVIVAHGYKDDRSSMLGVADILHQHGFRVLVTSFRGHDENDGDTISFGLRERADLDAFYRYLHDRSDIDRDRIGLFGVSMGGTIAIGHAAENPGIRALVSDCAFSSVADTVGTSIKFFTGLPAFPFAPAITFWVERAIGGSMEDIDAKRWIARISPRPVLLMQGGADHVVSPESGRKLFDAAGEPKELWFEPDVGHAEFLKMKPKEFEERLVGFFDRYLR